LNDPADVLIVHANIGGSIETFFSTGSIGEAAAQTPHRSEPLCRNGAEEFSLETGPH